MPEAQDIQASAIQRTDPRPARAQRKKDCTAPSKTGTTGRENGASGAQRWTGPSAKSRHRRPARLRTRRPTQNGVGPRTEVRGPTQHVLRSRGTMPPITPQRQLKSISSPSFSTDGNSAEHTPLSSSISMLPLSGPRTLPALVAGSMVIVNTVPSPVMA